jgi:uncharacterized protein
LTPFLNSIETTTFGRGLKPASLGYERLRLLVMQPTGFCNLNCSYCYLPDRHIANRMSFQTLDAVFTDLLTAPFLGKRLAVVWHAGEPLTVGIPFYERAVEAGIRLSMRGCQVTHSIQTNATLINEDWCAFFKRNDIRVGVSLDGPAFLNDLNRKTRTGKGTHAQTMRGLECLRKNGIDFYAICVLTRDSLNYPKEIFEFFYALQPERLCFNIEEMEGQHTCSSMCAAETEEIFRKFISDIYELSNSGNMQIREFQTLRQMIASRKRNEVSGQCLPFAILSVSADGNFSSFSPELLSTSHSNYGSFAFGNINREPFISMIESAHFRRVHNEILAGVKRCRANCQYFVLCGGGAPSNKVFENGTFDSMETTYCRLAKKAFIDVCLEQAELELGIVS